MKILIVNDDSIHAPGIRVLANAVASLGDVYVVAPEEQCSAMSQKLTIRDNLIIRPYPDFSAFVRGAWSISGTPVDCAKVALRYMMEEKPDLVLSGVNNGYNVGFDTAYSGTVGAAMEAARNGIPAIALSTNPGNYDHATDELDTVLDFFREHRLMEKHSIYNVNIPAQPKGIRITRQGGPFYSDDFVPEENNLYRPKGIKVYQSQNDLTIDSDAVTAGYISIMPLTTSRVDMAVYELIKDLSK